MLIQDSNENHDSERFANRHASTFRTLRLYARTFCRNTSAMFGLAIVVVFLFVAAIGPWIVPFPEDATGAVHLDIKLQPPDSTHWFGTDEVGNDVFTRVVLGTRVTLQIACIVTGVAMLIGVPLGMIAGLVFLGLGGCESKTMTHGHSIDEANLSEIRVGESTRIDLLASFG